MPDNNTPNNNYINFDELSIDEQIKALESQIHGGSKANNSPSSSESFHDEKIDQESKVFEENPSFDVNEDLNQENEPKFYDTFDFSQNNENASVNLESDSNFENTINNGDTVSFGDENYNESYNNYSYYDNNPNEETNVNNSQDSSHSFSYYKQHQKDDYYASSLSYEEMITKKAIDKFKLAGSFKRLVAFCIDAIFSSSLTKILLTLIPIYMFPDKLNGRIWIIVYIIYSGLSVYFTNGYTIGKVILGIRIKDENNEKISLTTSFIREITGKIVLLLVPISGIIILLSERKQALYDILCDTVVLKDEFYTINKKEIIP